MVTISNWNTSKVSLICHECLWTLELLIMERQLEFQHASSVVIGGVPMFKSIFI